MARQLEDAQRTFIADYEAAYGVGGQCPLPDVQAQYDEAVAAVAVANAVPDADDAASDAEEPAATQRQREYDYMKDFCDNQIPQSSPDVHRCSTLSAKIDHAERCVALYEAWDEKWLPGRHSQKISEWKTRTENVKEEHRRRCTTK